MAAENTATFAIDFNAQGAVAGANAATGSLEKLREQLDEDTAALANMQRALKNLQGGTSVNIQAFQNLKKTIEAKKATIAQTQERYLKLGGTFRKTKAPVDQTGDALKSLFEKMQKGGGPLGGLAGRLQSMRTLLAGGGALVAGAAAFAAALVAIGVAALVAAAALFKYGIAAADAYRSERLQLEGLTKVRNWYGIAAGKAADLQSAIDNVSGAVALERSEIIGLEKNLYRAGFRGAGLEEALLGVATATAAAGEEQGTLAQALYMSFGRSAAGMKKVSGDIKARFGDVASAQMLSLGVQSKKLKESFNALFRGLKIEGFLGGLKSIRELFSQSTASGRALKQILEFALQPLIDGSTSGAPLVRKFFIGAILMAQQLTLAYLDVRMWMQRTFGDLSIMKNVDMLSVALFAGRWAVATFAVAVAALGLAVTLAAMPFILAGLAAYAFVSAVSAAWNKLSSIDWSGLGGALIDGFVGGITRGIGRVISAVKNVGKAALDTLKGALDSHSPSRKGLSLGFTYPQGAAVGIQKGVPLVQKASERLGAAIEFGAERSMPESAAAPAAAPASLTPQIAPTSAPAAAPAPSGSGLPPVQVSVVIHAAKGEEIDEAMIRRVVSQELPAGIRHAFEGVAASMGARA